MASGAGAGLPRNHGGQGEKTPPAARNPNIVRVELLRDLGDIRMADGSRIIVDAGRGSKIEVLKAVGARMVELGVAKIVEG